MSTRADQPMHGPYADRSGWSGIAGATGRAVPARRLAFAALVAVFAAWFLAGLGSGADTVSREFTFTGRDAHFVVPPGVCRVRIEAAGASGGLQGAAGTPGLGARVSATLGVSPAEDTRSCMSAGRARRPSVPRRAAAAGTEEATAAQPSTASTGGRAGRDRAAAGRPTSDAGRRGSKTASWSPGAAQAAAVGASWVATA